MFGCLDTFQYAWLDQAHVNLLMISLVQSMMIRLVQSSKIDLTGSSRVGYNKVFFGGNSVQNYAHASTFWTVKDLHLLYVVQFFSSLSIRIVSITEYKRKCIDINMAEKPLRIKLICLMLKAIYTFGTHFWMTIPLTMRKNH